jgi:hypothetical protein
VGLTCVANDADDPCAGIDCSGHGSCRLLEGRPTCDCDPGYRHAGDESGLCGTGGCDLLCVPTAAPDADAVAPEAAGDDGADDVPDDELGAEDAPVDEVGAGDGDADGDAPEDELATEDAPVDDLGAGDGDADVDGPDDGLGADDAVDDGGSTTCPGGRYDPSTGLCWQEPPEDTTWDWAGAAAYCDGLSLGGHGPGSWRMPDIDELRSLIRGCPATETGGACAVTEGCLDDDCWTSDCNGCVVLGGPAMGGCYWPDWLGFVCLLYWSSSSYGGDPPEAWAVSFMRGLVISINKTGALSVRCVRPGP